MQRGGVRLDVAVAALLAAGIMVAFEPGIVFGSRLIGYDATTLVYPWYANALMAFAHGPFVALNPYEMGGMVNFNLLANYDPIYYLPVIAGGVPSIFHAQLLVLAHLLLIPLCFIALARLYDVSGPRLVLVGMLGAVAAFTGFDLKYMETTEGIDGYAWGVVLVTAIEYYRVRKKLAYAIVAALALDFALMRFAKGTVYWPIFIVPYVAVFWSQFKSRAIWRDMIVAAAVFTIVVLPCVIEMSHMWRTIESSVTLSLEEEGGLRDLLSYFGYYLTPGAQGPSVFAIAGIIALMTIGAFTRMNRRERWFFGAVLAVLFLYALGSATPMEGIVRLLYPPADPFRRAYEELSVVLPIAFMVIIRYAIAVRPDWQLSSRWRISIAMGLLVLLGAAVAVSPGSWAANVVVVVCSIAFLFVYRRPVVVGLLIVAQWVLIAYIPVANSIFYPHPATAVTDEIHANIEGIESYLTPRSKDATSLYRVMAVGVNPTFGPYAGVYQFYNLAPDTGTRLPRELYEDTQLRDPLSSGIADSLRANPAIIASPALRKMAVRYYFLRSVDADIASAAQARHPELRNLAVPGDWRVLEDPLAYPFVSAARADETLIGAIPGTVDWDTIDFVVPKGAMFVNVAYLYDDWWQANDGSGAPVRTMNDAGQLRLMTNGLAGARIELRYHNAAFTVALVLQMLCYVALAAAAVVGLTLGWFRRRDAREQPA